MSGRRYQIPAKEELVAAYSKTGCTISSLAREYSTTQPTVRKWLIHHEIPRKSHKQASTEANNRYRINNKPSKETLIKVYEGSSIKDLETHFGVGQQTIYEWFDEYGLKMRSLQDSCRESKERKYENIQFTRELLDEKYDRSQSIEVLAEELGVSRSHIRGQLVKNSIEIVPLEPAYRSKAECELYDYLEKEFPEDSWSYCNKKIINPFEIDIVNHTKKIAIEYGGLYWHSEFSNGRTKYYHQKKYKLCKDVGYKLITVFESDDMIKVKSLLLKLLGKTVRIGARNTKIVPLDAKEARIFHDAHHLHNSVGSKYHYGLKLENELVMVASFGSNRFSKNEEYECTRITSHSDFTVVGGVSKLIKNFIRNHDPQSILTFADLRFGDGNVYPHCGFTYIEDTAPNYWYSYKYTPPIFSRVKFQKHKLKEQLEIFDQNKTEYENMIDNGWDRIWDCGNAKYVYNKKGRPEGRPV